MLSWSVLLSDLLPNAWYWPHPTLRPRFRGQGPGRAGAVAKIWLHFHWNHSRRASHRLLSSKQTISTSSFWQGMSAAIDAIAVYNYVEYSLRGHHNITIFLSHSVFCIHIHIYSHTHMHIHMHIQMYVYTQQCKQWAQREGFDYHFNVDTDEYLVPRQAGVTLMDAMDSHVLSFSQSVVSIPRFYFQVSPVVQLSSLV